MSNGEWAEECGKLVLYNDPFVAKHKNKYTLLRKMHYEEKAIQRNLNKLVSINNTYEDWQSKIVSWYNKWVTNGYYANQKHLFLDGEAYNELKAFIKQIMGIFF